MKPPRQFNNTNPKEAAMKMNNNGLEDIERAEGNAFRRWLGPALLLQFIGLVFAGGIFYAQAQENNKDLEKLKPKMEAHQVQLIEVKAGMKYLHQDVEHLRQDMMEMRAEHREASERILDAIGADHENRHNGTR